MSKLTIIIVDSRGTILDQAEVTERELVAAQESPAKALMLINKVNSIGASDGERSDVRG